MPSVSKKQQKFMGIVRAIQKGEADPSDFNKDAQDAAKKMKKSSVKKYAKTKHKGLPNKKVNERAWTPAQEKAVKELDKKFYKLIGKKGIEPYSYEASQMWTSGGFRKEMRKIFGKDVKESLTPAEVKKERELFKKTGELPPRLQKVVDDYENERKAFHKKMKKKFKGNVKGDWVDVVVPGLEWMSKLGEAADRDYKAEYKKFQSSPKAKKYRAELNKYNRQKGTYGNGDGKDASHKGGKIVGFEKESTNRGRAEKSRLKKEITDYVGSIVDEVVINEGGMELKKLEDAIKMFKKKIEKQGRVTNARDEEHLERLMKVYNDMGGRKIKENSESLNWLQEKCWKGYEKKGMKKMFGKMYPNCVKKKKKSESVDEVKPIKLKGKTGMGKISHLGVPQPSKGVEKLFRIADKGFDKVGGVTVDGMSASLFKQIYNKANDDIKNKLNKKSEKELVRIIGRMWDKFGKNVKIGSSL